METDYVVCMDALELLRTLPDGSVDGLISDFPYAVHEATWDVEFNLPLFWQECKRVLKPYKCIVTTGIQPFTTRLINSNPEMFKYSWVWVKSMAGNFFNAKMRPMSQHEDVMVFSEGGCANGAANPMPYYPQGLIQQHKTHSRPYSSKYRRDKEQIVKTRPSWKTEYESEFSGYPSTVLNFANGNNETEHPNQKPLPLYEYLIRTYTLEGDLVIDPFCGSGTTALAARNTGRHYIGGDSDPHYCEVTRQRLQHTSRDELNAALSGKPTTMRMFDDK